MQRAILPEESVILTRVAQLAAIAELSFFVFIDDPKARLAAKTPPTPQHFRVTLMRAQPHLIITYALASSRSQYITALPRGVCRAGHRRARRHMTGRTGAGGGHAPATCVGRERARQLGASA
jgi:hypothetical protein